MSISHQGQFSGITISFNLAPGVALGQATSAVQRAQSDLQLPAAIIASFQGNAQAFQDSLSTVWMLIGVALLRFRPILMTTMAAMLGGVPLMLGTGAGSELRQPLGYAIVGRLIVSQALTLFTTPVIYIHFDQLPVWLSGLRKPAQSGGLNRVRPHKPPDLQRGAVHPTDRR